MAGNKKTKRPRKLKSNKHAFARATEAEHEAAERTCENWLQIMEARDSALARAEVLRKLLEERCTSSPLQTLEESTNLAAISIYAAHVDDTVECCTLVMGRHCSIKPNTDPFTTYLELLRVRGEPMVLLMMYVLTRYMKLTNEPAVHAPKMLQDALYTLSPNLLEPGIESAGDLMAQLDAAMTTPKFAEEQPEGPYRIACFLTGSLYGINCRTAERRFHAAAEHIPQYLDRKAAIAALFDAWAGKKTTAT